MTHLKVFAFNPNGIRGYLKKAENDFKNFLHIHKPDVLFLIETKMNSNSKIEKTTQEHLQQLYKSECGKECVVLWSHCQKPGRHGCGVMIRNDLNILKSHFNITYSSAEPVECEGRAITVELDNIILVGLYVVNAGQNLKRLEYKKKWNTQLQSYLTHLRNTNDKPIFVLGDLNVAHHEVDISNPGSNRKTAGFTNEERNQFTELLSSGWIDVWRDQHPIEDTTKTLGKKGTYTFWSARTKARSRNAGWRIDYVLCDSKSYPHLDITSYILEDVPQSDHCPVGVKINFLLE